MSRIIAATDEEKLSYIDEMAALMTESERKEFCEKSEVLYFDRDEPVYTCGGLSDNFHCLVSGHLRLSYVYPDGRKRIVSLLQPFHIFGLRPYLARKNFMFETSTIDEVILCRIPNADIMKLFFQNRCLAQYMLEQAADTTFGLEQRLLVMMGKHLRGRMAYILLYLKKSVGRFDGRWYIDVDLRREDLAGMADMTTANAIRTLSAFVSEGLITLDRRKIIINDVEGLRRISEIE